MIVPAVTIVPSKLLTRTGPQYDALNRVIKATNAYAYGPGTIPYEINGLTQHTALGQTPTFTTNASGWVDVKFGMNADLAPSDPKFNGIEVYDRDPFGFAAAQRNKTGTSAWTVPNMFSGCDAADAGDTGGTASAGFAGNTISGCNSGGALYPFRTDGYSDGSLSFHGVRTYDSDTQQWSTADALGGMLPYNYANNNPAVFADPSGFDGQDINNPAQDLCGSGGLWQGLDDGNDAGCESSSQYFGPSDSAFGYGGEWHSACDALGGCSYKYFAPLTDASWMGMGGLGQMLGATSPGGDDLRLLLGNGTRSSRMTCSVVPGGELMPAGCNVPPGPCNLRKVPGVLTKAGGSRLVGALGAYLMATMLQQKLGPKEALGLAKATSIASLVAQMEYAAVNAAYAGCPAGPAVKGV